MPDFQRRQSLSGFTLIEVMVTIVILAVGLLGLALLQANSLNSQLEAYQRAQALLSLEDMANRIRVNSVAARAGDYLDRGDYGLLDTAGLNCTSSAQRDMCDWNDALAGSAVTLGATNVGNALGARGCIQNLAGSTDGDLIIQLTVAWQGFTPTVAPPSACGRDTFGTDDRLRRVASVRVVLADLAL
jgi:type IV pilus assembly protein PilV